MRQSPFAVKLVKATPLLALAVPFVVFGFLQVLVVQPERGAARAARVEAQSNTAAGGSPGVADTIRHVANSPAVGGVKDLSVLSGVPGQSGSPVTVTFDAEHAQVERFLSSLRSLPGAFDLRSFELEPSKSTTPGLMSAKIMLFMFKPGMAPPTPPLPPPALVTAPVVQRAAEPRRPAKVITPEPIVPDPVVNGILFSSSRQLAVVNGRVVKPGDRVGPLFVRAIERDGVILSTASGLRRRVALVSPAINGTGAVVSPY